jgi:hypothetical protein
MPVITRSQIRNALRNRRNVNVRKLTFVLRSSRDEDYESDSESDSEPEYIPSDDESTTSSVESESQQDSCDDTGSECDSDSEYDPVEATGEEMKCHVENLRSELAEAEYMLAKWEEEQANHIKSNAWCDRAAMAIIFIIAIIYVLHRSAIPEDTIYYGPFFK